MRLIHTLPLGLAPLALGLALTACGDSTTVADASDPESVADAAANLVRPQAGQYRQTGELVDFTIEGISPEITAQIREGAARGVTEAQTYCITQEQADAGFEDMVREMNSRGDDSCQFSSFEASANTLNATMTCGTQGQGQMTMNLNGTIAETTQDMTMTMDGASPMGSGAMHMVVRTHSERIGDCPG
ncbi:MAG: DUF3617 domain-containing protein [Sphingomonadaceae bacterium]|nr:DUF3617 domain-containing protein [Sphingomonadaceae bacterium]